MNNRRKGLTKKKRGNQDGADKKKFNPGGQLFKRTQGRLTLTYSLLTVVMLALFVSIVYFLVSYIVISGQKDNLLSLIAVERAMVEKNMENGKPEDTLDNRRLWGSGSDQLFYYVVDANGNVVSGNEIFSGLRDDLLRLVKGWNPSKKEIMETSLSVSTDVLNDSEQDSSAELVAPSKLHLMITGQNILTKGGPELKLYAGINVTSQYTLLHRLLILLVLLSVLFVFVACLIGWLMSRKAMEPVVKSYNRQREFVGDASHELRTPLSVMLSSVDALELELGHEQNGSSFASRTLVNLREEIRRMTRMVQNLLLLARSDSDELELAIIDFDFRSLAENVIGSIERLSDAKSIEIELIGPSQINMHGDPEKLRQVLTILLDNAIKYTPQDGLVRVTISDRDRTGRPAFWLEVKDSGPGISAEDAGRIFDRFYRGDKSRKRETGGHGLGLAIAKWIVEAHQGQIFLVSEVGKGSTFSVRIPVKN